MLQDRILISNVAASTPFTVMGGRYNIAVIGSTFGTVKIQKLGPDGTTYLDLFGEFNNAGTEADLVIGTFAANGVKTFDLAPGAYQATIASATAVYVEIARVTVI